ncbi:peptidase C15, pyroglutamyl peptidase I-like protein [Microstroma glucosiphilum]|uniref:Peptidase C15, pyroglutamyl peptidase I-like protein n=1 Tax=Pseudomicrostroma glucosiphilum TaxID=1684307 RepID=A0A316UCH4_9BASI|nr:peptidase C15, pyroglutamyl peptidase I-like protein [Pseudomicrostroma glucosiphilum]PWN22852.1 peptidase C15, pyroglutamyl peptidase I-like protein [Pseudomicrostroma glucosiphilum]
MAPITPPPAASSTETQASSTSANEEEDRPYEVLITGFGPFGKTLVNPSWSIATQLHDVTLYPPVPPPSPKRNIHIQSLNLPVSYANTLDAVPRIHGQDPTSPYAKRDIDERGPTDGAQGDGAHPYPSGYAPRLHHPAAGYDLVIHIGVGLNGGVRVEKQAHKEGYKKRDAFEREAPPSDHPRHYQSGSDCGSSATKAKGPFSFLHFLLFFFLSTLQASSLSFYSSFFQEGGGFGKGYEDFKDVCKTTIDVDGLVAMLEARGCGPVSASTDPGRYLCDFTYYCSLAESRRATVSSSTGNEKDGGSIDGAPSKQPETQVLFIHVPQVGQPHSVEDGRKIVVQAIGWILWGR